MYAQKLFCTKTSDITVSLYSITLIHQTNNLGNINSEFSAIRGKLSIKPFASIGERGHGKVVLGPVDGAVLEGAG